MKSGYPTIRARINQGTGGFHGFACAVLLAAFLGSTGWAANITVLPPEDFSRSTRGPMEFLREFDVPTTDAPYLLRIYNGGLDGDLLRVSSGIVRLNGRIVVGPDQFKRTDTLIEQPISPALHNQLVLELRSKPGSGVTVEVVAVDNEPPVLSNVEPVDGTVLSTPTMQVQLTGNVADTLSGVMSITCNGASAAVIETVFSCSVPLTQGQNVVQLEATDNCGNLTSTILTYTYVPPPTVTITSPQDAAVILASPVSIIGEVDQAPVTVTVNGIPASIVGTTFSASVPLPNGQNTVIATAVNEFGGQGFDEVNFFLFNLSGPTVTIDSPPNGFVLGGPRDSHPTFPSLAETVQGKIRFLVSQVDPPTIKVNDLEGSVVKVGSGLLFESWNYSVPDVPLSKGANTITAVGEASNGNQDVAVAEGIVDFCVNEGKDGLAELCDDQSNRCHEIDGCSVPDTPILDEDDPTQGELGLASTAFGKDTMERLVHGQRPRDLLPCNLHDLCYQTCDPTGMVFEARRDCDVEMLEDMLRVCERAYPEVVCPAGRIGLANCQKWRREKDRCFAFRRRYFVGLRAGGRSAYVNRQEQYCF